MNLEPEASESGAYVKLKDGESIVGLFTGEAYKFYSIFEANKYHVVPKGTQSASMRFKLNIILKEGPAYVVKIFENSKTVYNQLADLNKEYPLEETWVKITRVGSGTDTQYSILPAKNQSLPAETVAVIKSLKLNKLEHEKSQNAIDPELGF